MIKSSKSVSLQEDYLYVQTYHDTPQGIGAEGKHMSFLDKAVLQDQPHGFLHITTHHPGGLLTREKTSNLGIPKKLPVEFSWDLYKFYIMEVKEN